MIELNDAYVNTTYISQSEKEGFEKRLRKSNKDKGYRNGRIHFLEVNGKKLNSS